MRQVFHKKDGRPMPLERKNALTGFLFTVPFCCGLLLFFLPHFIQAIAFAFQRIGYEPGRFTTEFVGWDNFIYAFREDLYYTGNLAASVTSLLYQTPVIVVCSIFFATLLNRRFFGRTFVRAVFFLPVIIASGVVLKFFQMDMVTYGVLRGTGENATIFNAGGVKELLIQSGLNDRLVDYFVQISTHIFDLMWRTGVQMLIILAGLQSIPSTLYEASSLEGASAWDNYWYVTIPMLKPMIFVTLIYTIIDTFVDPVNPVMKQIQTLILELDNGRASAMAIPFMLVILVVLGLVALAFVLTGREPRQKREVRR